MRPKLKLEDKISILYKVFCQMLPFKDVAKEHRVSVSMISRLAAKARGKPQFLKEIDQAEM